MKKYKKQICLIAAVCLLGTAAFCGYHIYDHYADEAEQTEAFENIAEIVEQAQAEDGNAPEVPLTEEENILTEYGELYLKNTDMVGWLSIAGTTLNYPVMQTPNEPNIVWTSQNTCGIVCVDEKKSKKGAKNHGSSEHPSCKRTA